MVNREVLQKRLEKTEEYLSFLREMSKLKI